MEGIEGMRHLRDEGQTQVPIIVITALTMAGDREKCLEVDVNKYLTKPIKDKHLTGTIQKNPIIE